MAERPSNRWWNREIALVALVVGSTTVLVAILAEVLLPGWTHSRRGAIVGGWAIFCISWAPLLSRRLRRGV